MARRGRKYCLEGVFPNPIGPGMATILTPTDARGKRVVLAQPAPGRPIPEGGKYVDVDTDDDGHYFVKEMRTVSKGPIKVSTPAFRKGWKKTFGAKGVN